MRPDERTSNLHLREFLSVIEKYQPRITKPHKVPPAILGQAVSSQGELHYRFITHDVPRERTRILDEPHNEEATSPGCNPRASTATDLARHRSLVVAATLKSTDCFEIRMKYCGELEKSGC